MRTRHLTAPLTRAVLLLGLLSVGITSATTAQAGVQLFEASWTVTLTRSSEFQRLPTVMRPRGAP
jgi:hypothetical protein